MIAVSVYCKLESRTVSVHLFDQKEDALSFLIKDAEEYYESLCREEKSKKRIVKEIVSEWGHATVGKWGTMEKTYTWDLCRVDGIVPAC